MPTMRWHASCLGEKSITKIKKQVSTEHFGLRGIGDVREAAHALELLVAVAVVHARLHAAADNQQRVASRTERHVLHLLSAHT